MGLAPARADQPLRPPSGEYPHGLGLAPDHVITMRVNQPNSGGWRTQVIRVKGVWVRTDTVLDDGGRMVELLNRRTGTSARIAYARTGEFIDVREGASGSSSVETDLTPLRLEQTDAVLGERCRVWDVARFKREGRVIARRLSCVTADGVVLWFRSGSKDWQSEEATATKIERRPVKVAEMRLPSGAMSRSRLLASGDAARADGASPGADFEAVMQLGRGPVRRLRSGGWLSIRSADLSVRDELSGASLRLERDGKTARRSLSVGMPTPNADTRGKTAKPWPPAGAAPSGKYLGEPCWNSSLQGADGEVIITSGRWIECYTADRILLFSDYSHRVRNVATVIQLKRRPVAMTEVLPRDLPLSWRDWGLEP